MPRKANPTHPALQVISKKRNPVIYNPYNVNHVSGQKGKFLHDPYARVFNVDESVKEAPVIAPAQLARKVPRKTRVFNKDPANAPMMAQGPTYAPSPIGMDHRPLDLFSREVNKDSLPSVTVNQTSNNLVGARASHAIAPFHHQPQTRTFGHLPDPNHFSGAVLNDIPMLQRQPIKATVVHPKLPVTAVDKRHEIAIQPDSVMVDMRYREGDTVTHKILKSTKVLRRNKEPTQVFAGKNFDLQGITAGLNSINLNGRKQIKAVEPAQPRPKRRKKTPPPEPKPKPKPKVRMGKAPTNAQAAILKRARKIRALSVRPGTLAEGQKAGARLKTYMRKHKLTAAML